MEISVQLYAPIAIPPGKVPGTHRTGAGWAPGPVFALWRRRKHFVAAGIRTPDRPVANLITSIAVPAPRTGIRETYCGDIHGYCEDRQVVVTKRCLTVRGRGVETCWIIRDIKILRGHRNIIELY
jgi:hypothetical protein